MNGGFRVRPDGQFAANSLNSRTAQKGIQEVGKTSEAPSAAAQTNQSTSASPLPSISLPKGGGAIRGIDEKFAANPVTGTGSLNVPIFTTPGRSGFGPQLSLSYDSGSGNGPFGFGWGLSLPSITRKTDKGLPKYQDDIESDVFILSGAEDLVPVFKKDNDGNWIHDAKGNMVFDEEEREGYVVRRFRPRIEGLFARIERWMRLIDGDTHWRSISKDNILTLYGRDEKSRIVDPSDKSRIFSWLICESFDDKGNAIVYDYETENEKGIDFSQVNEFNRQHLANRYLKRVFYGNRQPLLLDTSKPSFRKLHTELTDFSTVDWMFEVVFDYGEGHFRMLPPDISLPVSDQHLFAHASESADGTWSSRPDPFSTYRAGFEIRTHRRCQRVLMFHRFQELGSEPYLVRSTEFDYSDLDYSQSITVETELGHNGSTRFASFIRAVIQSGYVRGEAPLTYLKKSLPQLEFEYSKATIHEEIKEIDTESLENLPYGLDGASYQGVDLDGEGLSGILTEQADAWFYKSNLGDGKFGPMERVALKPSLAALNSGSTRLLDLAGDGQLDVAELGGTVSGFYERTEDQKWENFIPFTTLPNLSWNDPNLRFVDLTGDGHADVMITENEVISWYPSLAEEGFGPEEKVYQSLDEEKGPRLVFADGTQSIYLSDMSGDGLSDIVRIRNGEVCYWPNLGYGRFGAKVTMDNPPWFDSTELFDQKRIRLADIDGSGTIDILYLGSNGIQIYFNHSGNSYSNARMLTGLPHIDNYSSIQVADLFGNGTACLVWSSPLPGDSQRPMLYIDLMGGQKPHLMVSSKNNLGAETKVNYVASTKFYLDDKAKGKPWVTKIPFPVHVVDKVETFDHISRNRFVTRYAYHHGYFDGIEREFRGFGMVEQRDTEEFAALDASDLFPSASNIDEASHVPPVLTKTWFHTGAYVEGETISRHFEEEYYSEGDPSMGETGLSIEQLEAMLLDDTVLPETLTAEEEREACRSLKGAILRQEIYAIDGTEEEDRPYSVSERNYTIEHLQPRGINEHAVFFTHAREAIDFHYERKLFKVTGNVLVDTNAPYARNAADPRVTHSFTLAVDEYGNVLTSVAVGYGRRFKDPSLSEDDQDRQGKTLITFNENRYTNAVLEEEAYRAPLPFESRTFEVLKVPAPSAPAGVTALYRFKYLNDLVENTDFSSGNRDIPYEDVHHTQATENHEYRRLIEHVRTRYRSNDLANLLPPGELNTLALPGESYKLAFTPGLILSVYQRKLNNQQPENLLPDLSMILGAKGSYKGGYVDLDGNGNWWIPSGSVFYDINTDEGNPAATAAAELEEASLHFFLPRKFTDPFGHSSIVDYDQPNDLLMVRAKDAVDNIILAENDYRVLQPGLVIDPNENRSKVIFDAMGMVAGVAVMGKETSPDNKPKGDSLDGFEPDLTQAQIDAFMAKPREPGANPSEGAAAQVMHDLLGKATSRIIYDTDRFRRTGEPPFAATIARETHNADLQEGQLSKLQVSFSYSDGFGREIQKKIQAELGALADGGTRVNPRWVGSDWTIFNNKGKPVRKYEPFFSPTHQFEFAKIAGVSSILFYDPVERVVATLHPNNTYEKVVFDPWHQKTWDVNDTATQDPRSDDDIYGYVAKYFATQPAAWQTWYEERIGGARGVEEQKAAQKTQVHADTPNVAHFDTLGRPFLTIAHNKFEREGATIEEKYNTRVNLDIEGNQREVIDTKERIVMRYDYDMLSSQIHQASMEAGERWVLNDVTGKPIRAWDSRGHTFRTEYDDMRRPIKAYVAGVDLQHPEKEILFVRTEYGEGQPDGIRLNMRTRIYRLFDSAGMVTNEAYDFKGNSLNGRRQLAADYKNTPDWSLNPALEEEVTSSIVYDALNRPIILTAPDNSVTRPTYNEANFLERMEVNLRGAPTPTTFIRNIDYNARGQRVLIEYGNGIGTSYEYDDKTFRLIHLNTMRGTEPLQDLFYTYDPVGNITTIRDDALQTIYFNGQVVRPDANYTYDAIYRLIEADGREHIGQASQPQTTWNDEFRINLKHPNEGQAMRNYFEFYWYDEAGNILRFDHKAKDGNWIRAYDYEEDSLIESAKKSNRLSRTVVHPDGQQPITELYTYDLHGNMTSMPHLPQMEWDFKDQLHHVEKGNEQVYYVYDAAGQRARKVVEKNNGTLIEERIYLGSFEIFRRRNGSGIMLERETLHILDDKQRIAMVETRKQGDDGSLPQLIRYQLGNHIGSACLELDDAGQIISYEEYYPYGSTSYQAVRKDIEVPLKRYRYTGMERDEENGLAYHSARYYLPWLGRWSSCDPIGVESSLNLYLYSHNNCVGFSDPDGKDPPPDVVTQMAMQGTVFTTTEMLNREGLHSRLVTTFDVTTFKRTQRLYRRDDRNSEWTDVTQEALRDDLRHNTPTPSKELSVDWNMPSLLTDEENVRNIKGPGIVYGMMPLHATPYLKDQTLPIKNPYTRFEGSVTQSELRKSHYETTQMVLQNLSLILDIPVALSQLSSIRNAFRFGRPTPIELTPSNVAPKGSESPTNLHAFGNKTGPRPPRAGKDLTVDPEGNVHPTTPPEGASTFGDPNQAPLTGHYHKVPEGTPMPEGLGVKADGVDVGGTHAPTHHTIYPTRTMTFSEFQEKFLNLPWHYGGKK